MLVALCALLGCSGGDDLVPYYAQISGSSMEPLLSEGDVVLVQPIPFSSVSVGDIVAYRTFGGDVLHRVVSRTEKCLYTKGDNASREDGVCVRRGDYLGIVRR